MKDGEMDLFAQLLLESRTCAYLELLDNELIMTANKKHTRGFSTSIAFRKKETQQPKKLIISFGVGKLFPLVMYVL